MEKLKENEVLKYEGVQLYGYEIELLKAPCPVTDRILEFFFAYLSRTYSEAEDLAVVPPHVSYFIALFPDETKEIEGLLRPFNLQEKNLIIFAVDDRDSEDRRLGGCIYHFSLLVYCRKLNAFVHHDSVEGTNSWCADRLFNVVKGFIVGGNSKLVAVNKSSSSRKGKKERRRKPSNSISAAMKKSSKSNSAALPRLIEGYTPQQINKCDCGLYVMSIARAICVWHLIEYSNYKKGENWFSAVQKSVSLSIESSMRSELLLLIHDLAIRDFK